MRLIIKMGIKKINVGPKLRCEYELMKDGASRGYRITFKSYITPKAVSDNYLNVVNCLRRGLVNDVRSELTSFKGFSPTFILDIDTAYAKMKLGKKSFIQIDAYVKTNEKENPNTIEELCALFSICVRENMSKNFNLT